MVIYNMRNFITENNLSFEQGSRNSTVVTLIGYAQFKGLTSQELIDILNPEITNDIFILEEINRLWDYCKVNNYKAWWKSEDSKLQYTF